LNLIRGVIHLYLMITHATNPGNQMIY